jgi:hypothetical protein
MFFGINLNEIFMFPIKDAEARKHLLIGALVALAAFFIPILPYLAIVGYSALIARQVLRGESPRMIAWEDWSGMLTSGLKLFGVRMIYSIPIFLLTLPVMLDRVCHAVRRGRHGQPRGGNVLRFIPADHVRLHLPAHPALHPAGDHHPSRRDPYRGDG